MSTFKQLGPDEFKEIEKDLSDSQRTALREVNTFYGVVGTRHAMTLRGLRRKGLVGFSTSLSPLGWQVVAALDTPPGTYPAVVAQVLVDAGFEWAFLPQHPPGRAAFSVRYVSGGVEVSVRHCTDEERPKFLARVKESLDTLGYRTCMNTTGGSYYLTVSKSEEN